MLPPSPCLVELPPADNPTPCPKHQEKRSLWKLSPLDHTWSESYELTMMPLKAHTRLFFSLKQ